MFKYVIIVVTKLNKSKSWIYLFDFSTKYLFYLRFPSDITQNNTYGTLKKVNKLYI
jgi:hypothetical protein